MSEVEAEPEAAPESEAELEPEPANEGAPESDGEAEAEDDLDQDRTSEPPPDDEEHGGSEDEQQTNETDGSSQASQESSAKSPRDQESDTGDAGGFGEAEDESVDPEFRRKFNAVKAEFNRVRAQAIAIQRKLLEVFPALGFEDSTSPSGMSDFPHRYQDALDRLELRRNELAQIKNHNQGILATLQEQCSEADRRRKEKEEEFLRLREESGRNAVMSRTNKPLRPTDLNTKETALAAKNDELETTRIDFIRTRNKHKQAEEELNKQDQLSEGLHLIDFEQLKIENQSLNEKKAEKNQDLVKIEDKIKINSHMLTHVKEKLAFARKQKLALQSDQESVEGAYGQSRAKLATARIHRDTIRDENSSLKKSSGLIGMTDLLYDFEHRSNELETMQEQVSELKTRFNDLTALQHELEAKISQRQPVDPALLRMNR